MDYVTELAYFLLCVCVISPQPCRCSFLNVLFVKLYINMFAIYVSQTDFFVPVIYVVVPNIFAAVDIFLFPRLRKTRGIPALKSSLIPVAAAAMAAEPRIIWKRLQKCGITGILKCNTCVLGWMIRSICWQVLVSKANSCASSPSWLVLVQSLNWS